MKASKWLVTPAMLAAMGLTGCTVYESPPPPRQVVVAPPPDTAPPPPSGDSIDEAPPQDQVEVVPASPGPGYVWVGGYYYRSYGHWYWHPGRWAYPPHPGAVWVRGRWYHGRGGWHFSAGFWE